MKSVGAEELGPFAQTVLDELAGLKLPFIMTRHGQPVAIVSPLSQVASGGEILGALKGSVLSYTDALSPVGEPGDWDSLS
ncbi:hypothetical protein BJF92_15165 [Rhizobium rhizosphaerae]|uniref:Antitoxin n=1 Tax=Xaviernesmea rhizosphaerae TaxID=1672749 RepID=A0A1Q9AGU4_9HYPH|nr:hypothetical protein [Xaviernesmea rhizosphaerae]OLP54331.1 hypothetical protein BJF92_15165 [Xaviernesmea rhizosphaerae]OQP87614.1 hypothetical protein BTR14_03340 [Xaviernesmea rhizosphaerae]